VDVTPTAGAAANQGFSGAFVPQNVPNGGFSLQSLSGNSIALNGATSSPSTANSDLAVNFDGAGNFTAMFDFTVPNLTIGSNGQGSNIPLNGSTYNFVDTSLGHGLLLGIPSGFFNNFPVNSNDGMVFYLIQPNQLVAIEDQGFSSSDIMFFEPQAQPPIN